MLERLAGLPKAVTLLRSPHDESQKVASRSQGQPVARGQQEAVTLILTASKEINPTNNLSELGSRFFSVKPPDENLAWPAP